MQKDMTTGNPQKLLIRFIIPLLISVLFQQLYTVFDSIVAGRAIGPDALAAIGASAPITAIFMAIAIGCCAGVSVVVSRFFGAKQYADMKTAVYTALCSCVVISVLMILAGCALTDFFLNLLKTPENIMADASVYLNIYVFGLFFLFLYNVVTGVFQALGNSKTPLYLLIASSIGNIVLNLFFVVVLDMGVAGLGWATFIAQGIAGCVAFVLLLRFIKGMNITGNVKLFSGSMVKKISIIAIPSICQQSFVSIGNLFVQSVINRYGSDVMAGYNAGLRILMFFVMCALSFSNGLGSYAAQNIGAQRIDRVYEGYRATLKMIYIFIVPCFILCFFGADFLAGIFLDASDAAARETTVLFLRIASPGTLVLMLKFLGDSILKAAGDMKHFMITTFSDLLLRAAGAFILSAWFGSMGIWLSWLIGWIVGTALSEYYYIKKVWLKTIHG